MALRISSFRVAYGRTFHFEVHHQVNLGDTFELFIRFLEDSEYEGIPLGNKNAILTLEQFTEKPVDIVFNPNLPSIELNPRTKSQFLKEIRKPFTDAESLDRGRWTVELGERCPDCPGKFVAIDEFPEDLLCDYCGGLMPKHED